MSYMPDFPEPGVYIKYWDYRDSVHKFRQLLERRGPLKYPKRMASVAAGSKGSELSFDELNPSDTKLHVYMAFLGVKPGFTYELMHPSDIKNLKWDEAISDIPEDDTANIGYEESPYEAPTKAIWIERDRYPALKARNMMGRAMVPEIIWIAALYRFVPHERLSADIVEGLRNGRIPSLPADFGGEL